jgi:hypothetical protein
MTVTLTCERGEGGVDLGPNPWPLHIWGVLGPPKNTEEEGFIFKDYLWQFSS